MALNPKLVTKLEKIYAPNTSIHDTYNGKDLTFVTNEFGEPVTLFIGKRRAEGAIAGERYTRKIVRKTGSQEILKSHWDLKGKVSGTL
ncbi:hypothetical protein FVR03_17880 [Pontibacter qinzhouensis]|uniref:Uncharacterized protein n=1 Tax=Pontibacter qinzhouensis TaxID=2603253 RepID=A0A5C8JHE5_9BACT|nr:hypothetical protein [Pontibacter qinzhouensis]TXK36423.1 hypothetical protein FVR03_17880 [Pontibacter qinzhouensis]